MRSTTIPALTVFEDIGLINETPGYGVQFTVGKKELNGNWIIGQSFQQFSIVGDQYTELNGPPQSWCPDKPTGTYRNEDLWHYVDLQRNSVNS
jgi:hypothetical protein